MVKVGDVVFKIAGRDAGQLGVIVDVVDPTYVLIDGATRRRKCNLKHLELLGKQAKIKKNATTADIRKALTDLGYVLKEIKKGNKKEKSVKPVPLRKSKTKEAKVEKPKASKSVSEKK